MVGFYFIRADLLAANVETADWRLSKIDDKAWFAVLVPLYLEDVQRFAAGAPEDGEERIARLAAHEPASFDKGVETVLDGVSQGGRTSH
jgi:hypothetical protein